VKNKEDNRDSKHDHQRPSLLNPLEGQINGPERSRPEELPNIGDAMMQKKNELRGCNF